MLRVVLAHFYDTAEQDFLDEITLLSMPSSLARSLETFSMVTSAKHWLDAANY